MSDKKLDLSFLDDVDDFIDKEAPSELSLVLYQAQKKVLDDPAKRERKVAGAKQGGITKKNSKEYQALMNNINIKKAQDPAFAENVSKGILKKYKDPVYLEKMEQVWQNQQKPIVDPDGKEWTSAREAGMHWFPDLKSKIGASRKVRNLCHANKNGWSFHVVKEDEESDAE